MDSLDRVAVEAAEGAGQLLRAHFGRVEGLRHKSAADLVTAADRAAEDLIVRRLRQANPGHRIVAEESGEHPGDAAFVWYVDPLDGTTNFVHGFPHFAVSIGLVADGRLELGVVLDPLRQELFRARRGGGASLNDRPIRTSAAAALGDALLATGFPYDRRETAGSLLGAVGRALEGARGLRRAGAAALDLAYVACGRLDGYWEARLKPWDTAAGSLLVREAGGQVTSYDGDPHPVCYQDVVASNGLLHDALRAMVLGEAPR